MRDLTVLSGSSHPRLAQAICERLGVPLGSCTLSKFSNKETNVEVRESVREQDVFIIQSGCGNVNDNFMELLIMIAACKTASARKVTAVLPCFPYARQTETPYRRVGNMSVSRFKSHDGKDAKHSADKPSPFDSQLLRTQSSSVSVSDLLPTRNSQAGGGLPTLTNGTTYPLSEPPTPPPVLASIMTVERTKSTLEFPDSDYDDDDYFSPSPVTPKSRQLREGSTMSLDEGGRVSSISRSVPKSEATSLTVQRPDVAYAGPSGVSSAYKQWTARSGTLMANMLTAAGADHIITMDLHDPQFQGFFDVPVDNLHSQPLMIKYIKEKIPNYQEAVIVTPDAGGAKRATLIADKLNMDFALVHKERRIAAGSELILVGDVRDRVCILVDDIADTSFTITRAAALLTKSGATKIYALITHGILSGDAVERIRASSIDEVVVGNSVPQEEHVERAGGKLKVFDVAGVFAEAVRRIHNGESVSFLFDQTPY